METITKAQVTCIKTLVGRMGADGKTLAYGVSSMRTDKVSELSKQEGAMMIKELKRLDPHEKAAEQMRRKLIGMCYTRAGLPRTASEAQKKAAVRWLDDWCKKYGHKHKALNSYTYAELPMLVSQFEGVMNSLIVKL